MKKWVFSCLMFVSLLVCTWSTSYANTLTQATISYNGVSLSNPYAVVTSDGSDDTTYMPIWYIGQALTDAGVSQSWNGTTHVWTLSTSQKEIFLASQSVVAMPKLS
ncbi:hypothetical protein GCM10025859_30730 [Alicyclobacillus fastidiosus]|nr:hypothetical protein GCM10025859_30730 [Alicyclobacillus fastidiosus]